MNLTKIFHIAAASLVVALGIASPAQAQVSNVYFSKGSTCTPGTNADTYTTSGGPLTVSLCMSTSVATCGHTIVLQSAASENGRFVVTQNTLGANYPDPNSAFTQTPLTLINPATPADLGGTTASNSFAAANNQLLATFTLAPQSTATGATHVISLANTSIVALVKNGDTTCGSVEVPDEFGMNSVASPATHVLTRNTTPVFTSPVNTTFQLGNATSSFTPVASGNPNPTITLFSGSVPGMSFNGTSLVGTPTANGTYMLTFRATGAGFFDQVVTVNVTGQASQTISFPNPGQQQFGAPITLSATGGGSGNPIVFSSGSPAVCLVSGNTLTMLTATTIQTGKCIVNANQAGNANYTVALQAQVDFSIIGTVPGAPTIGTAINGNGQATISFTAPTSSGGRPITGYIVNCGAFSNSGLGSPITITGLSNGTSYNCTASAISELGTSISSGVVVATPSAAAPLALIGVKSRKVHAGVPYDLVVDTARVIGDNNISVEPRLIGSGFTLVFEFSGPVTAVSGATSVDALMAAVGTAAAPTFAGNEVTVVLTGVANTKRATITVTGVNATADFPVALAFLNADVNGTHTVDVLDVISVKGKSGFALNLTNNFLRDINFDGTINVLDVIAAKGKSGTSAP